MRLDHSRYMGNGATTAAYRHTVPGLVVCHVRSRDSHGYQGKILFTKWVAARCKHFGVHHPEMKGLPEILDWYYKGGEFYYVMRKLPDKSPGEHLLDNPEVWKERRRIDELVRTTFQLLYCETAAMTDSHEGNVRYCPYRRQHIFFDPLHDGNLEVCLPPEHCFLKKPKKQAKWLAKRYH
jgi:hypothetical protein